MSKIETNHKFPKIFIIILNWNGKKDTLECLESIQKIDYPNYETVVIDNGSTDDSVSAIRKKFKEVLVIKNKTNLGFAGGNNVGIKYALSKEADNVLLLNNDTTVNPRILKEFVSAAEKCPEGGLFSAKIYYYDAPKRIWHAGVFWKESYPAFAHVCGEIDNGKKWEDIKEVEYANGCALFIRVEALKAVGVFDERFFNVWEESDLAFRARQKGYTSFFVPRARVWHKISTSFGGRHTPHFEYFLWRNRLLWIEKNKGFKESVKLYYIILRRTARQFLNYIDFRKDKKDHLINKAALQGTFDYIMRRFGNCPGWLHNSKNRKK